MALLLAAAGVCAAQDRGAGEMPIAPAVSVRGEAGRWVIAGLGTTVTLSQELDTPAPGTVGTEAGCDWTVRYADISSPVRPARVVPVPLFELVYHDAILTTYAPTDLPGLLAGGVPQMSLAELEQDREAVQRMAALNERMALVEMTGHEFLDLGRRRERTTFADGTTVTVDAKTATVRP